MQAKERRLQTICDHISPTSPTTTTSKNNVDDIMISSSPTAASSTNTNNNNISLSSHVLETGVIGKPYHNLKISLYVRPSIQDDVNPTTDNNKEALLATGLTNDNGRVTMNDWQWNKENNGGHYPIPQLNEEAMYRVRFWLRESGYACMYPFVDIHFQMKRGEHYHIPLLLSPFGYTTYKGS